jgi:hypothetical protein
MPRYGIFAETEDIGVEQIGQGGAPALIPVS